MIKQNVLEALNKEYTLIDLSTDVDKSLLFINYFSTFFPNVESTSYMDDNNDRVLILLLKKYDFKIFKTFMELTFLYDNFKKYVVLFRKMKKGLIPIYKMDFYDIEKHRLFYSNLLSSHQRNTTKAELIKLHFENDTQVEIFDTYIEKIKKEYQEVISKVFDYNVFMYHINKYSIIPIDDFDESDIDLYNTMHIYNIDTKKIEYEKCKFLCLKGKKMYVKKNGKMIPYHEFLIDEKLKIFDFIIGEKK
jgi:hypothetical protein